MGVSRKEISCLRAPVKNNRKEKQRPQGKPRCSLWLSFRNSPRGNTMRLWIVLVVLFHGFCCVSDSYGSPLKRILVVSSYHREYPWSQETHNGFCAAMLKLGYFDNKNQMSRYSDSDYVETSRAVIKKLWMDSKRRFVSRICG